MSSERERAMEETSYARPGGEARRRSLRRLMARAMVCVACITATPSIGAAQDLPVPVRVEADAPNIVLQQRTSLTSAAVTVSGRTGYGEARSYIDVCVLPCSRSLPQAR